MDKIKKLLKKLELKEKRGLKKILSQIKIGNLKNLDLKRLKGKKDVFRVRKGSLRIIFYKIKNSIKILTIERRSSKTYRKK